MNGVAVLAGSISTALFVVSALPMLYKAARTKELGSYSLGYLVLANVGNGFYSIYLARWQRIADRPARLRWWGASDSRGG